MEVYIISSDDESYYQDEDEEDDRYSFDDIQDNNDVTSLCGKAKGSSTKVPRYSLYTVQFRFFLFEKKFLSAFQF